METPALKSELQNLLEVLPESALPEAMQRLQEIISREQKEAESRQTQEHLAATQIRELPQCMW